LEKFLKVIICSVVLRLNIVETISVEAETTGLEKYHIKNTIVIFEACEKLLWIDNLDRI